MTNTSPGPRSALSAPPRAATARAGPDREALQQHREAPFQHFGVGEAGIGHVRVDATGAVETLARARAAADGFVILVRVIAEGEVVHRALRRTHHAERAVQRVGDALRGLDIAS